jgi:hypothetical protein
MEAVSKPVLVDRPQARDVIVDVLNIQRDQFPAHQLGCLIVRRRFQAPGQRRGNQLGGRRARIGQVALRREAVGAHLARFRGEKEANREEHDLGQPPGPLGDQPRRGADLIQHVAVFGAAPGPVPETIGQRSRST